MEDAHIVQEELNLILQIAIQERNHPSLNAIQNEFDPKLQITSKIEKLIAFGHDPSKMEIVIVGGTFLFMPKDYQKDFIKSCYDAQNGIDSENLEEAKSNNEHAEIRNCRIYN